MLFLALPSNEVPRALNFVVTGNYAHVVKDVRNVPRIVERAQDAAIVVVPVCKVECERRRSIGGKDDLFES